MDQGREKGNDKWELLLSGHAEDMYESFRLCYDDLYRLGIYLYQDVQPVREAIHLLYIEVWKIRDKLGSVQNIRQYVLTIFKRILYKLKTGAVNHWSKIESYHSEEVIQNEICSSYEEILVQSQEQSAQRQRLINALPLLGERQRELIRLRFFEEKTIEEIAKITGLTARTVYNTLHNSLGRLREILG